MHPVVHRGPAREVAVRAVLVCLLALTVGCASIGEAFRSRLVTTPEGAAAAIEQCEREAADGRSELALRRARDARAVRGLTPQLRDQLDLLIERIAATRVEELSGDPSNARKLADLSEMDLPQQISVAAALRSARGYLALDRPFKAYRTLRKLEERYPRHHGRSEAGELLVEAGLVLANDPWSFLFLNARDDGVEILEYLVLTYPSERRCDEAFAKLAAIYEDDRRYGLAIQRHEELLFAHPESSFAPASQARIPHLRLVGHESPEYDRTELLRARKELESWLARNAGDPLEPSARLDYADCLQRLVRSDMGIARYYRRIDRPYGARYHAERALRLALETSDDGLTRDARKLLASIPAVTQAVDRPIEDDAFSADSTLLRTTIEERAGRPAEPVLEEPAPVRPPSPEQKP